MWHPLLVMMMPVVLVRSRAECAVRNASCVFERRGKGSCSPLGEGCSRPCGNLFVHLRGTGGKWFGESLLNHLYYYQETNFVVEGSSLRSGHSRKQTAACTALGDCRRVTILRHPVERILSRYWMEGSSPSVQRPRWRAWGRRRTPPGENTSVYRRWWQEMGSLQEGARRGAQLERMGQGVARRPPGPLARPALERRLQRPTPMTMFEVFSRGNRGTLIRFVVVPRSSRNSTPKRSRLSRSSPRGSSSVAGTSTRRNRSSSKTRRPSS